MSLYTTNEIMDLWDSNATAESKEERMEVEEIRKDIDTAQRYIADALARYRKDKTRSRSKAKGSDPFAELAEYSSRNDIQEAYGWGTISENEMDRLTHLWDLRESSSDKTILKDRVTDMLETAMRACSDQYIDKVLDYDAKRSKMRREAERIARENLERRAEDAT